MKDNEEIVNMKHNQYRCPNCDSTEIVYDEKIGKLKCSYCQNVFEAEKAEEVNVAELEGKNISKGAKDIKDDDIVTLTCNSCGANVVINAKEAPVARCHWCRSVLSLDDKIENGAIPDVILPFSVSKDEAINLMKKYVSKKRFFAKKDFINEFSKENIMGVYLPYMLIDENAHCHFSGTGEHETNSYEVVVGHDKDGNEEKETRYDADLYQVLREFDIEIDDLTIESSSDKINKSDKSKTNNIINAIMPFDTENCIIFQSNYLIGYNTEKRDLNVGDIENKVNTQIKDICRLSINKDLKFFDRGIKWEKEEVKEKGKNWTAATLPVWLYSYCNQEKKKEVTHYIAVNGRTKEVVGSIPLYKVKLGIISAFIEVISIILCVFINMNSSSIFAKMSFILLLSGIVFYFVKSFSYRNKSARHSYESETKYRIHNITRDEKLLEHKHDLSNSMMFGANNKRRNGD